MKNIVIVVLVATIVSVGYSYFFYPEVPLGLSSGPSHFQAESFLEGLAGGRNDQFKVSRTGVLSQGGTVLATSSRGVVTLTAANVIDNGTILYTTEVTGGTLTLPTKANLLAASASFIPNSGDRTTRWIVMATTTRDSRTTLAGNTGVILQFASSTPATSGLMSGGGFTTRLEFWRSSTTTDIYVTATHFK